MSNAYPKYNASGVMLQRQPASGPAVALTTDLIGNTSEVNGGVGTATDALNALAGKARYHTTAYDPIVLFQGDNAPGASAIDVSGNGFDAPLAAGSSDRIIILPGDDGPLKGFYFDAASYFEIPNPASDANVALRLLGDMTIEWIGYFSSPIGAATRAVCGMGSTPPSNCLYRPGMGSDQILFSFWKLVAGTNVFSITGLTAQLWVPHHYAVVRSAGGTTETWWQDGQQIAQQTGLTPPDGGTTATFKLGAGHLGDVPMLGAIASFKLVGHALTDNEVRSEYNYTLGNLYGLVALEE